MLSAGVVIKYKEYRDKELEPGWSYILLKGRRKISEGKYIYKVEELELIYRKTNEYKFIKREITSSVLNKLVANLSDTWRHKWTIKKIEYTTAEECNWDSMVAKLLLLS